eukprot:SAG31_NODE_2743_length_5152_cov_2.442905_1_plen_182_part_00
MSSWSDIITGPIVSALNGAISSYFEDINASELSASLVTKLKLTLSDLKLKPEALQLLDDSGLPIELKGGTVEELTIDMSGNGAAALAWSVLRGHGLPPIVLLVKGVYVCIGPKQAHSANRAALELQYAQWTKQEENMTDSDFSTSAPSTPRAPPIVLSARKGGGGTRRGEWPRPRRHETTM